MLILRPERMSFAELLVAVAAVKGIRRVRFTTSHPRDFGRDIVEAIDAVPGALRACAPAGAERVDARCCGRWLRTYTREEYLEKIALIRAAKREISITTDIIVGFPGRDGTRL